MAPKEDSIIVDYFTITKEYQQKYGEKVILLMQVGAFFEVYGLKIPKMVIMKSLKSTHFLKCAI